MSHTSRRTHSQDDRPTVQQTDGATDEVAAEPTVERTDKAGSRDAAPPTEQQPQSPPPALRSAGGGASRGQSVRQLARKQARLASARRREERAGEERRLGEHVTTVLTALGEREAMIEQTELRAGSALLAMTRDEGLSMREALRWCGDVLGAREATRLRRLAEAAHCAAERDCDAEHDGASARDAKA